MWKANEEYIKKLIDMGIPQNAAERALLNTGNNSAELAATWVFDNQSLALPELKITAEEIARVNGDSKAEESSEDDYDEELPENYDGPYKMVFVVNTELGMGIGKIAAQVAHAALGLHRSLINNEMEENSETGPLMFWEEYDGEKKIALKGDTTKQLQELEVLATQNNLACYLVQDAGHTQVPAGSTTVLSIFGKESEVNKITGKLKLL